ncbi:MAG: VPLPA-CTERM sorting domain-containing protein [Pseudomonadota bacterium]
MRPLKLLSISTLIAAGMAIMLASPASAATIVGKAVDGVGSSTQVGNTVNRPMLGDAIEYFIPLSGSSCTYGVNGCGLSSDIGKGGPKLSMFLEFSPVDLVNPSTLDIWFEDLDLKRANDPSKFFERFRLLDASGDSLLSGQGVSGSGWVDNINDMIVNGDLGGGFDIQYLTLDLGVLQQSPFYLELEFKSKFTGGYKVKNTPEYLTAKVTSVSAVPLPAGFILLLTGIGGFGLVARRRNKVEA